MIGNISLISETFCLIDFILDYSEYCTLPKTPTLGDWRFAIEAEKVF